MKVMLWKPFISIAPVARNDFRHSIQHVAMSPRLLHKTICRVVQSMQEEQVLKQSAMVRPSVVHSLHCGRLRSAANDCERFQRLRTVAVGKATSSEHTSTPRPPKINENPTPQVAILKGRWSWNAGSRRVPHVQRNPSTKRSFLRSAGPNALFCSKNPGSWREAHCRRSSSKLGGQSRNKISGNQTVPTPQINGGHPPCGSHLP